MLSKLETRVICKGQKGERTRKCCGTVLPIRIPTVGVCLIQALLFSMASNDVHRKVLPFDDLVRANNFLCSDGIVANISFDNFLL